MVVFAFIYSIAITWRFVSTNWEYSTIRHDPPLPLPLYECPHQRGDHEYERGPLANSHPTPSQVYPRILLIINSTSTPTTQGPFHSLLSYLKVPIRVEQLFDGSLLEVAGVGRFSLILFNDYRLYHSLPPAHKQKLLSYCANHSVGLISLISAGANESEEEEEFGDQFTALSRQHPKQLLFPHDSPIATVGKRGAVLPFIYGDDDWVLLTPKKGISLLDVNDQYDVKRSAALLLKENDGVDHIVMGQSPAKHWMMRVLLHDALSYLAPNLMGMTGGGDQLQNQLQRHIQIDIDDIFVSQSGTRLVPADVEALIQLQKELATNHIEDFRFTLGFSGYFFRHQGGDALEIAGDEALVGKGHEGSNHATNIPPPLSECPPF